MRPFSALLVAGTITLAVPGAAPPRAAVAAEEGSLPQLVSSANGPSGRAVPMLRVTREVTGLTLPWDVQPIGGGRLLLTERNSARLLVAEDGVTREVDFPSSEVWVSGETGLMSLEVDRGFTENGRFYTCQGGTTTSGGHDVRVVAWRLDDAATRAERIRTLLSGLPATSGQHGGCRLLITRGGTLLVGTGDAAVGTNPRNRTSLGGKTLRLDPLTGAPWPTNPWVDAENRRKRYVLTYGHRNVQGLAQRADGSLWSVEHGSYRDDEVNRIRKGGDYGWHPVPGYNERVPMTDHSLPGRQYAARWRSGNPTVATSGAAWVRGRKWGDLNGTLAVACLGGERLIFMRFDASGTLRWTRTRLRDFGRLRSVSVAPNRDLLITTSNGSGGDAVLRVSPQ
ncbi:MAG: PQQ-dependent sugar dehydrogenase [Nocardioides sp.]